MAAVPPLEITPDAVLVEDSDTAELAGPEAEVCVAAAAEVFEFKAASVEAPPLTFVWLCTEPWVCELTDPEAWVELWELTFA